MDIPAQARGWSAWRFAGIAGFATIIITPVAAGFSVPWAFTFVQLPGVLLIGIMALISVVCFLRSPRRPLLPKLIAVVPAAFGIYCLVDSAARLWIFNHWH